MDVSNGKFYRARLSRECVEDARIISGVRVTKEWTALPGSASRMAGHIGVEAEDLVRRGGKFVPASEPAPAGDCDGSAGSADGDPSGMTAAELRGLLESRGMDRGELRGRSKAELVELAEASDPADEE